MKEVIFDQHWFEDLRGDFNLYYMYRDFTREKDKELFQKNNIRFDVTIIPPNKIGKEYVKTAGHFHPEIKEGISYPEVYEVMHGEGIYLLQNEKIINNTIELIIVEGVAGDQILIPPGYGHITINPSDKEPLVMNNLVSSKFSSIYGPIKENNGAAYLFLTDNTWIKNPKYTEELMISKRKPSLISKKPFYLSFLENTKAWEFLNEPWNKSDW
ncbi:MAG: glucose-6-phosphate isomerase family protein [Candidatus Thorarchaeota archaeon]